MVQREISTLLSAYVSSEGVVAFLSSGKAVEINDDVQAGVRSPATKLLQVRKATYIKLLIS